MALLVYIFILCLEPTLGKDTWMRATSATVMIIFLKVPFWISLYHNYIQSSTKVLNNCEVHWRQHFERHPAVDDFTDMHQGTC